MAPPRPDLEKDLQIGISNIISGTARGQKFRKKKVEPIDMKRLWFYVTDFFEEVLNAFD